MPENADAAATESAAITTTRIETSKKFDSLQISLAPCAT
jgi:hypothetical protein